MVQQRLSYALLIETGSHAGMVLPLTSNTFTIGRELDNTLVLDSFRLSRYHARLRISPAGTVLLEDLNSTNGTFVAGKLVSGVQRLSIGESFDLAGTIRLRLIEDEGARAFVPPEHWVNPAVEPDRKTIREASPSPAERQSIAPPTDLRLPSSAPESPQMENAVGSSVRQASGARLAYAVIGLLSLALCGVLGLSVYMWFAPPSFWQQVFSLLGLAFPTP